MAKLMDIQNAREKINDLIKLRDNLVNATPLLTNLNDNLSWYEKAYGQLPPEYGEKLLVNIEQSVLSISEMNVHPFSYAPLTGATGSFAAVSADTKNILIEGGSYYELIKEYEAINAVEKQFDQALATIHKIDSELAVVLEEAKRSYQQWKGNLRSDSDLAKDVRTFQDLFKGHLQQIRMRIDGKKAKDFSWPKMAETLTKTGGGNLQRLRTEQGRHERLHLAFTEIFKGTKTCADKDEMEQYIADYIGHLLILLGTLKGDLLGL